MKQLHVTPETQILNTVAKFRIEFYGKSEDVTKPDNEIQIRVYLSMVVAHGKKSLDEMFCRVQASDASEDEITAVFDSDNKTLLAKGKPIRIANRKSVIASIDKAVKEELTTKKFGNVVGGNYPDWM